MFINNWIGAKMILLMEENPDYVQGFIYARWLFGIPKNPDPSYGNTRPS